MSSYDLIVIGSGPGGQKAAIQAGKLGKKVAIVEMQKDIGGFCTHKGTIPSKSLKYMANFFNLMDKKLQLEAANIQFLKSTFEQTQKVIEMEVSIAKNQLERNNVEIIKGKASFLSSNEIVVAASETDERKYSAKNFIIATGSRPRNPRNTTITPPIYDSDTILEIDKLPASMIVEGGGVIGSEYACIFNSLGVKVTLINRFDSILFFLDNDIRQKLMEAMKENGIDLYMNQKIIKYHITDTGVRLERENDDDVHAECALICSGRQANIDTLNLSLAKVNVKQNGTIDVDSNYQTTQNNIYAVGDVIGHPALAAAAMVQGRRASRHCLGLDKDSFVEPLIPMGIYTIPEVSYVGMTEEALINQKIPYAVGKSNFHELARAQIEENKQGLLKILFHPESLLIHGIHILGRGACDLVHYGQAVIALGGTIKFFMNNPANFPTYSGAYKVAAINGLNIVSNK